MMEGSNKKYNVCHVILIRPALPARVRKKDARQHWSARKRIFKNGSSNTQTGEMNIQHGKFNIQNAIFNIQNVIFNIQNAKSNS